VTLPVILHAEAREEFDEAFDWYERKRPGLGVDFMTCVQETLKYVSKTPRRYPEVLQDVRRAPVRRFPYSVLYRVESSRVMIFAVFHGKRDPKVWQERV
jgi:plasmid stabilization system protein ParE